MEKYYVFYNFDNTPVDIARGFDCDLEKNISEMQKQEFIAEEVSYLEYEVIKNRMSPSRQLLNLFFALFSIAIIATIATCF